LPDQNAYQSPELVSHLASQIKKESKREMNLMEVCGGHTHAIRKFGLRDLLPSNINLLSGPGCPVCVTSTGYIDQVTDILQLGGNIVCTFGDLMRVPGSTSNLELEKTRGRDIRIVLSSLQALSIAERNPQKKVVFCGIGFETTAPSTAASIIEADRKGIKNFFVLSAHKIMPPAMKALTSSKINLDGFICPGHVSTIAGSRMYEFLPADHSLACVVSGFEPADIMISILMLVRQLNQSHPRVEIQYQRAVNPEGNKRALSIMRQVFNEGDDWWRGLGIIRLSGLRIGKTYAGFDASAHFGLIERDSVEPTGCSCGEILRGEMSPPDCKLFGRKCTPENPVGACMVSNEGACNAFFRYKSLY
jgi:hydrogenase expression/formation protein HypD